MKRAAASHKVGIMGRYLLAYVSAIVLAGILIASVLMVTSVRQISKLELDYRERSIQRIAGEMEAQQKLMASIHSRMMISYHFQPAALSRGVTGELELLEDITNYAVQSPIASSFFILYAGDSDVYLSSGKKATFSIHLRSILSCSDTEAMTFYDRIQSVSSYEVLSLDEDTLLFVYSVRFPSSRTQAWTCFFVPRWGLESHLENISGFSEEKYTVYYGAERILGAEGSLLPALAPGGVCRQKEDGLWQLAAQSETGGFSVAMTVSNEALWGFQNVDSVFVVLILALILVCILLLATGFAWFTSRPIRDLAVRISHAPVSGNELEVMEDAFSRVEHEKNISVKNLRDQIVISLLDGNYSPALLSRWSVFQITLDGPCFAVFLVKGGGDQTALARQIEAISDEELRLYAVWRDGRAEIIASFEDASQMDMIADCIQSLSGPEQPLQLYTGEVVDSPYKIHLSRLAGLALLQQHERAGASGVSGLLAEDRDSLITGICMVAVGYTQEKQLDAALDRLREYVRRYAPSLLIQKHLCYDLLNQLMRHGQEKGLTMDSRRVSELLMIQNFDVFLRDLRSLLLESFPPSHEEKPPVLSDQIMDYIQQNACDCNLSVDRVTTLFRVTSVQLNNLIKARAALCFKEYVTCLRMKKATDLLVSEPDMTVNEISCICGYNKPSNFIKKFKEFTGQTPAQYRRQEKGE